jgi:hypothetical protein
VGDIEDVDETEAAVPISAREEMVAALGRYLTKTRLVSITKMSLAGHDPPKVVNGAVPDIEGLTEFVGQPVFGAAEECGSYRLKDSRTRLDALSRVTNAAVFLVVPNACFADAREYVRSEFPDRDITVLPYGKKP